MAGRFSEHPSGLLLAGPDRPGFGPVLLGGYVGPSMNPTLFEGDMLEVRPYAGLPVRPGDVLFFRNPAGPGFVVHRAAARTPSGVLTRGDNNPRPDPYLVRPADIVGRVVAARRRNRRRMVSGGWRGIGRGRILAVLRPGQRGASRLLHASYRLLAASGVVRDLLPAAWRPRCISTRGPGGEVDFTLEFLGRAVGRFDARLGAWRIRRPYRIFVDEASLPRPPETRR